MPRLLHILDYEPRGTRTIDHYILEQTRLVRSRGWEIRFAFSGNPPAEFAQRISNAGSGHIVIPFPFTSESAREMIAKLGGYRPDITMTSFLSAFTPSVLKLKRRGFTRMLVVIDHSSGETPARSGWRRLASRLRGWRVGRIIDLVVPVSHAIARRDVERVFLPAHKVRVVHNGIPLENFAPPQRRSSEVVRVAYAGQLIPQKGVMTLLRAHERLRRAGVSNYELLIAGKGGQEEELRAFCASSQNCDARFLGHINSIPELFASADIVVIPSEWYEAFGLVAAEAMACGAACLVSDAGALSEVVGEAGRVFRAGDDRDLAEQLGNLVKDREACHQLGTAGRVRVEKMFRLDRAVRERIELCEALLGTSAKDQNNAVVTI